MRFQALGTAFSEVVMGLPETGQITLCGLSDRTRAVPSLAPIGPFDPTAIGTLRRPTVPASAVPDHSRYRCRFSYSMSREPEFL
jgi:hypothetical protein